MSQPKFLGLIGYQISLAMELRWRALPAGSAIISAADFPLLCSNSARKCLIIPAEWSPQKSLIMLEILPAEFIQA